MFAGCRGPLACTHQSQSLDAYAAFLGSASSVKCMACDSAYFLSRGSCAPAPVIVAFACPDHCACVPQGKTIVTASASSIRFWSPRQLAMYAKGRDKNRAGLTFRRTARSSSDAGVSAAACRRPSDPDSLPAQLPVAVPASSSGAAASPFEQQQPNQQQGGPQPAFLPPGQQSPARETHVGQQSVQPGTSTSSSWHGPGYSITPASPSLPSRVPRGSPPSIPGAGFLGPLPQGTRSSTAPVAGHHVPFIPALGVAG